MSLERSHCARHRFCRHRGQAQKCTSTAQSCRKRSPCGHSTTKHHYGKAKDHYKNAVTQGVNIGNTEERRKYSSIAERLDLDPVYRKSLRYERRTQKYCEVWYHFATIQTKTDPKFDAQSANPPVCLTHQRRGADS